MLSCVPASESMREYSHAAFEDPKYQALYDVWADEYYGSSEPTFQAIGETALLDGKDLWVVVKSGLYNDFGKDEPNPDKRILFSEYRSLNE